MTSPPPLPRARPEPVTDTVARAGFARRRALAGLAVAATIAALLTWAVAIGSSVLAWFDREVTAITRGWADPLGWPVDLAHAIGLATAPVRSSIVGAVVVIALLVARQRAAAAWVAMSGILGVLAAEAIKSLMGRERPPGAAAFEQDLTKSFPSGHAMVGIYLYLVIGLVLVQLGRSHGRRWLSDAGWVLVWLGPLIGATRLVLGVHWPSDLLAGWAFGSVVALATALLLWWPLDRGWSGRAAPHRTGQGAPEDVAEAPDQLP